MWNFSDLKSLQNHHKKIAQKYILIFFKKNRNRSRSQKKTWPSTVWAVGMVCAHFVACTRSTLCPSRTNVQAHRGTVSKAFVRFSMTGSGDKRRPPPPKKQVEGFVENFLHTRTKKSKPGPQNKIAWKAGKRWEKKNTKCLIHIPK